VNEVGIASWSHAHRTPAGLTSPQILSPTLPLSEMTSPPSIYGTATGVSPLQSHDGPASQLNHPPPASPPIRSAYDIELNDLSSREAERPPPPEENGDDTRAQQVGERRHKGFFPPWLCGLAVFLAPVNIVSGMTASHGDNWKLAFVGFFIAWLLVGSVWLFLDLRTLPRSSFTKRCIWHLSGCVASMWFYMSILHITSNNLPQWLPTVIDCGIGASLGLQNIPATARNLVGEVLSGFIGSTFGATQVIVGRAEEQLLDGDDAQSLRRRRQDIETGSMA